MYWYFLMAALLVLMPMPCAFAAPSAACSAPEYHRLNFWLGDWDSYGGNGQGPSEARNRVTSILGGCVILENYRGTDGLHGESFTIYDASRHVWHQTWVTNRGRWLVLEGDSRGTRSFDEPGKREARGEEPAVAPAGVAGRSLRRPAKAAPGRKAIVEETVRSNGFRTQGVPQRKE
jgi:hypothetical protein